MEDFALEQRVQSTDGSKRYGLVNHLYSKDYVYVLWNNSIPKIPQLVKKTKLTIVHNAGAGSYTRRNRKTRSRKLRKTRRTRR